MRAWGFESPLRHFRAGRPVSITAKYPAGARLDFGRVAMKPGKPLMAGVRGEMLVLGLPGNPVSAFVTASLFLERKAGMLNALPA